MDLLACEITARTGKDPADLYRQLEGQFGKAYYARIDSPASAAQRACLIISFTCPSSCLQ